MQKDNYVNTSRRNVLKAVGASAVTSTLAAGTATGEDPEHTDHGMILVQQNPPKDPMGTKGLRELQEEARNKFKEHYSATPGKFSVPKLGNESLVATVLHIRESGETNQYWGAIPDSTRGNRKKTAQARRNSMKKFVSEVKEGNE